MRARFGWDWRDWRVGIATARRRLRKGTVEIEGICLWICPLPCLSVSLAWVIETSVEAPPDATSSAFRGEAGDSSAGDRQEIIDFRAAYEAAQARFAKWRAARSSPGFPEGPGAR